MKPMIKFNVGSVYHFYELDDDIVELSVKAERLIKKILKNIYSYTNYMFDNVWKQDTIKKDLLLFNRAWKQDIVKQDLILLFYSDIDLSVEQISYIADIARKTIFKHHPDKNNVERYLEMEVYYE